MNKNINITKYIQKILESETYIVNKNITKKIKELIKKEKIDYKMEKVSTLVGNVINDYFKKYEGSVKEYKTPKGKITSRIKIISEYERINFKSVNISNHVVRVVEKFINNFATLDETIKLKTWDDISFNEGVNTATIEGTIENKFEFKKRSLQGNLNDLNTRWIKTFKLFMQNDKIINSTKKISKDILLHFHNEMYKNYKKSFLYSSEVCGRFKVEDNAITTGYHANNSQILDDELDIFINEYNKKPKNLKEAIERSSYLHGFFEVLHPFNDGNGRIGRFLITFYFKMHNFTNDMIIFVSEGIDNSRLKYYEVLMNFTFKKDSKEIQRFIASILSKQKIDIS